MRLKPGWAVECDVMRVIGDTVEVEIRKRILVKLLDCQPRDLGLIETRIKGLCLGTKCLVHVPSSEAMKYSVSGYLYLNDISINETLVKEGLCIN